MAQRDHLDHVFIAEEQDVVLVLVGVPSFNMVKPTAANHWSITNETDKMGRKEKDKFNR